MSLRVVLELVTGAHKGRRMPMGPNQQLTVGRSSLSDFVAEGDPFLGNTHFLLETDSEQCHIVDKENTTGTLVNGKKVATAALANGDKITAGNSQFKVFIEGAALPSSEAASPNASQAAAATAPLPVAKSPLAWQTCATGVLVCHGTKECLAVSDVAQTLATLLPMWMVIDWKGLGREPPAEGKLDDYLFDWLPEQAARLSPWLVGQTDVPNCREILETGWGRNGLVCLFSSKPKTELIAHWRQIVRSQRDAILGVCWPGVLGPVLEHFHVEMASKLMAENPVVLVERTPPQNAWQIFTTSPPDERLKALGFGTANAQEPGQSSKAG